MTYLRHSVLHPGHFFWLATLPFAVALVWQIAAFATLVFGFATLVASELVVIVVIPRTRRFRVWVDTELHARDCAASAQERASLLARMTEAHRAELQRLEALADRLRERVAPLAGPVDDCLGIDRLLATYVRAAVSYQEGRSGISSREAVAQERRCLAEAASSATLPSQRALAQARLEIARMRSTCRDRATAELETIEGELALIGELVRLTYECSAVPVCAGSILEELTGALASAPDNLRTVQELTELISDGLVPDPGMLRLGRSPVLACPSLAAMPVSAPEPPPQPKATPPTIARIGDEDAGRRIALWADAAPSREPPSIDDEEGAGRQVAYLAGARLASR